MALTERRKGHIVRGKKNTSRRALEKTPFRSWCSGKLHKGCRQCVRGEKLVLYVTGICSRNCFFCPLSDQRKNKDIVWANEVPIHPGNGDVAAIFAEAQACSSAGAGITGGDPLVRLERTVRYIRALKRRFGKGFHIHLYTPLERVTKKSLSSLYAAGLDEIRFHPDLYASALWGRMTLAKRFDWDIGIEIPALPGAEKQTKQLIDFACGTIKFLNINELEISDTNSNHLLRKGFVPKDRISYGVAGSEALAKRLARYAAVRGLDVHYCTTHLKDAVQLAERLKRRARNVAKGHDIVTDDGMLLRGAIYTERPGVGYRRRLCRDSRALKALGSLAASIVSNLGIRKDMLSVDVQKMRLLVHPQVLEDNLSVLKKGFPSLHFAIVEEYPTYDGLEVEIIFL